MNDTVDDYTIELKADVEEEYRQYASINAQDGYSLSVVWFSLIWAIEMQREMRESGLLALTKEVVDKSSHDVNKEMGKWGITGAQYAMALAALKKFWKYGDQLAKIED